MAKPESKRGSKKQKTSGGSQFKKTSGSILVYSLCITLFVFLTVNAYVFWHTSQPQFCASCHNDAQKSYDSWASSKHKTVACNECHWPGFAGVFKQKISLVSEVYNYYAIDSEMSLNEDGHIYKNMKDGACTGCHNNPLKLDASKKLPLMKHDVHTKKKINCTSCHSRIAHPDPNTKNNEDSIKMTGCFRCHGLEKTAKAPGQCDTCHASSFNLQPRNHRNEQWKRKEHANAADYKNLGCQMCHENVFCKNCHGIDLPHPAELRNNHADTGTENAKMCRKCHKQQDFCNSCHHYGFNGPPGSWVSYHDLAAAQKTMQSCFECHSPTYCAKCHAKY